jgi:hypothetical protein
MNGAPFASRPTRRTTRSARGATPRPAEVAPGLPPSPRSRAQPVAAEVEPREPGWGEQVWQQPMVTPRPSSVLEAEPFINPRLIEEEAVIRQWLPPGVPLGTPPRGMGPKPSPGPPWPGSVPLGPQPMRQPLPLNRELLRRLLLRGGV